MPYHMLIVKDGEVANPKKDGPNNVVAAVKLEERAFSSGSKGFYYRGHIKIDGVDFYAQVIISRK